LRFLSSNPGKHPNYNSTWEEFWDRRYGEIETEGKDPETHNYEPEWRIFWKETLQQLLDKEYEDKL